MTFAAYPSLARRCVFVTGGATGIGASLVEAFHGQGANIAFSAGKSKRLSISVA